MNHNEKLDLPPGDPLTEAAEAVLSNRDTIDRLMEEVENRRTVLDQWKKSFHQTLSAEERSVQEYCRDAVMAVEQAFEKYQELLEEIAGYGQTFDKSVLQNSSELLEKVSNDLNLMFLSFRNDALIARGPSTHSGLNTLINTIDRILAGEDAAQELHRDMFMEVRLAPEAIETISQGEENYFNQGIKYFYWDYSQRLSGFIGEYFQNDDNTPLKELKEEDCRRIRKELLEMGEMYREFDVNHLIRRWGPAPTGIPQVNLVINTLDAFVNGKTQQEVVEYFIDELWLSLDTARFHYDGVTAGTTPASGMEADEAAKLGAAIDEIGSALEELDSSLNEMDEPKLPVEPVDKIKKAADDFSAAVKALQEISEESGKVTCFKCGQKNFQDRMFCTRCRALLPQMAGGTSSVINTVVGGKGTRPEEPGSTQMTKNVKDLLDTAGAVADGSLEAAELVRLVEEMEGRLKQSYKYVKDAPAITGEMIEKMGKDKAKSIHDSIKEAGRLYKNGLDTFGSGLAMLRMFAVTGSAPSLEEARKTLWKALESLQQSQQLLNSQS